jgi:hypothetical protein
VAYTGLGRKKVIQGTHHRLNFKAKYIITRENYTLHHLIHKKSKSNNAFSTQLLTNKHTIANFSEIQENK